MVNDQNSLETIESDESSDSQERQQGLVSIENMEDGYTLTFSDAHINVAVFGCDGTGNGDQKANAAAVKKKVDDGEVHFVIHLGDAVYRPNGDGASKHSHLKKQLIDVHENTHVPFFMVKGNHEENIQRHPLSKGYKAGLRNYQKVHKFFQGENFEKDEPPKIPIGESQEQKHKFNTRPQEDKAYYTITCKVDGEQIPEIEYIVIDSNTLPYDEAQKDWLRNKIQSSTAKHIAICCHHPILTYDKRLFARNDSKYYRDRMLAEHPDPELQQKIRGDEQFYRRAYGLSHNRILKGVFRDEIIGKITGKENNANVKKLRGFITAHNHSQGTIHGKKSYEAIFIQGAAGKEIVPPKHKKGFDVKNKMRYNNTKDTGFGIVKTSDQTITVESYILENNAPKKESESKFNNGELKTSVDGKKITENNPENSTKTETLKKLRAFDKILRKFVLENKEECRKSDGEYGKLIKYARYLHNRLGFEISRTDNEKKLKEFGDIAQTAAENLIKIKNNAGQTNNQTENYTEIITKYFGDNPNQPLNNNLLKNKHFYHNPLLRKFTLGSLSPLPATAFTIIAVLNIIPILGQIIDLAIIGILATCALAFLTASFYKIHVCRTSNQYRFFSEASKLVEKAVEPSAPLTMAASSN